MALILLWLQAGMIAVVAASVAAPGLADFESGVARYRAGEYSSALDAFLAARDHGFNSPNLTLNLGLTYYRMERYFDARAAFDELLRFPDYRAIADFHLGLVAARLGEKERAIGLWHRVARTDPALRDRAQIAMERLDPGLVARPGAAYFLGAVGHDSNPALVDDSVQAGPTGGSSSMELSGTFDYPISRSSDSPILLRAGGYARNYTSADGLDQRGVFAGLSWERLAVERRRTFFTDIGISYLDGERIANAYSAGAQTTPAVAASGLALQGQVSRVEATDRYAYLEGWRVRSEAELRGRIDAVRLRAGYQFEWNDRADLDSGSEFFSHSPVRHRLGIALDHSFLTPWFLQWSLRYRHSAARDANRFMDAGSLREETRIENLLQGRVQARRTLGSDVGVLLEYQYSRNAASIKAFDYQRHVVLLGLEWMSAGH